LAAPFEPALALQTGRFHWAGTIRPTTLGYRSIVHSFGMFGKIVLFSPDDFSGLTSARFQPGDGS
jgi:hypothetical protein